MNFDEIAKKVEEKKDLTLDELFELWKEAQTVEEGWEETTLVKDTWTRRDKLRKYFTADGIIDSKAYQNAHCKVLVVLKEPNVSDNKPDDYFNTPGDHRVWYNEFVNGKYDVASGKVMFENKVADNPTGQKELIGRMTYLLDEYFDNKNADGICPTVKQIQEALRATAVMNLNKRGGDKELRDKDCFKNYCKKYAQFIKHEIELINPDVVIWCVPEISNPEQDFDILSEKVIIPMLHTARATYIPNDDKDLPFSGNELSEYCDKMRDMNHDEYMKFGRPHIKYILVFRTRVLKAFESERLE